MLLPAPTVRKKDLNSCWIKIWNIGLMLRAGKIVFLKMIFKNFGHKSGHLLQNFAQSHFISILRLVISSNNVDLIELDLQINLLRLDHFKRFCCA